MLFRAALMSATQDAASEASCGLSRISTAESETQKERVSSSGEQTGGGVSSSRKTCCIMYFSPRRTSATQSESEHRMAWCAAR